jgi:hypothetical protein
MALLALLTSCLDRSSEWGRRQNSGQVKRGRSTRGFGTPYLSQSMVYWLESTGIHSSACENHHTDPGAAVQLDAPMTLRKMRTSAEPPGGSAAFPASRALGHQDALPRVSPVPY